MSRYIIKENVSRKVKVIANLRRREYMFSRQIKVLL
jgi:hypothetical protein